MPGGVPVDVVQGIAGCGHEPLRVTVEQHQHPSLLEPRHRVNECPSMGMQGQVERDSGVPRPQASYLVSQLAYGRLMAEALQCGQDEAQERISLGTEGSPRRSGRAGRAAG